MPLKLPTRSTSNHSHFQQHPSTLLCQVNESWMSWLVLQDSMHTQMYQKAEQLCCQSYSTILPPLTIHCDHTMLTQKHLFLLLLHFCLTMWILNTKSHKFTCSWHSLEFATSMPWTHRARLLLQRQPRPYTTFAQYRFMPELIRLWKHSMADANK